MIRVRVSLGKTINIGNYESLRVDLAVETDVDGGIALENIQSLRGELSEELTRAEREVRTKHSMKAV